MKKRVLFLVTEDWYFASHRLAFARALVTRDYEVAVACRVANSQTIIEEAGIRVFPVPFARERVSPIAVLRAARVIRRVIREYRPALVHLVSLRPILIAWLATIGTRRPPFLNAVTGMGSLFTGTQGGLRLRITRFIVGLLFTRAFSHSMAETVFQNAEDHGTFVARGLTTASRSRVIRGSGVDVDAWTPRPEPEVTLPVVLFVSRLLRDKGLEELVDASVALRDRGVQHTLRVVGDLDPCNPFSYSQTQVQAWADTGAIEWLGRRSDVLEQMSAAHVVALPSYREGLPKVLLEAGVAQRAVVTTDVVGCREVVKDGRNGLLVPARDSEQLALAIERLLREPELRSRLALEHRRRVSTEFAQSVVTEQFLQLYEKLIPDAPASPPEFGVK